MIPMIIMMVLLIMMIEIKKITNDMVRRVMLQLLFHDESNDTTSGADTASDHVSMLISQGPTQRNVGQVQPTVAKTTAGAQRVGDVRELQLLTNHPGPSVTINSLRMFAIDPRKDRGVLTAGFSTW